MEENKKIIMNNMLFDLDHSDRRISQFTNPENNSSFDVFKDLFQYYLGRYDTRANRFLEANEQSFTNRKDIVYITLPKSILNTPELIEAPEYIDYHNKESIRQDWNMNLPTPEFLNRLKGELPEVDIAGFRFRLDIEGDPLMFHDQQQYMILLDQYIALPDGAKQFYFDEKEGIFVQPDERLVKLPENIVLIELPPVHQIDPVGAALIEGKDPCTYIADYPVRDLTHLKVIPLLETTLPEKVRRNQIEQEAQGKPKHAIHKQKNKGNKYRR